MTTSMNKATYNRFQKEYDSLLAGERRPIRCVYRSKDGVVVRDYEGVVDAVQLIHTSHPVFGGDYRQVILFNHGVPRRKSSLVLRVRKAVPREPENPYFFIIFITQSGMEYVLKYDARDEGA